MPPKGKKGGNGAKKGKDRRRMNTESSTESTGVDADFVPSKLKSPKKEKPESLEDPVPSSSNGAAAADDTAGDAALAQQLAGAEAEAPLRRSRRQCSAIGKLLISDQVEDSRIHAKKEAAASKSANRHALDHYDFDRLCTDPKFDKPEMFRRMEPEEFTMDYYNESGLNEVLMFKCPPEKLGMKMAGKDFTVRDVERLCGPEMKIACVKVEKQETVHMKLKNFISYYYKDEAARKGELYNVLSLEFSNTELAELVRSPELVRKIDWMRYWPDSKKHRHVTFEKDGGYTTEVHYPRVSNYCLMSVQKCYTDFHIDFYGTSVWYHVHTGKKIFWIMRPTAHNLQLYEEYLKTPDSFSFLGDTLECARVVIEPGCTVIIPSGWIHAVYTPVDSLVFGGNFLHIRQIDMQLCVAAGERRIGIGKKYLYPYSEEALFFTIADKVKKVTGRMYVRPDTRNKQDHWLEYVGEKWMAKNEHRREPKKADYKEGGAVWDARWEEDEEYLDTMKKFAQYEKETSEGERVAAGAPSLNDTGLEDETEEPDTDEERKAIKMEIDSEQASTSTAIPAGEFQIKKEETDVFAFTDDMPQLQKAVSSSSLPVKRTSGGAAMAPSLQAEEHSPSQSGSQGDASSIADDDTANDVKPFAKRASAGTKISYNDQISEDDRLAWEEKAKKADRHHLEKTPDGTPHDDFFIDDTTFFHPESFGVEPSPEDRKNGQQFVHMWAVSEKEPALRIDEEALAREIHPREIYQLEYILYHLLGKHSVDVPFGMSRPNSLLKAFRDILVRRRAQLAEQGVEVESISPIEGKVKEFPAVVLDPQIPVVRKRVSFKTWFNPDEVGLTPVSPRKSHKKKASVSGGSMDSSKDLKRKSKTMFEKMEEEDSDYSESAASSGFHSPSPVKTKKRKSTESDLRRTVITPSNGAPRQQSWRPNVTPPVPGSGLQPLPSGYRSYSDLIGCARMIPKQTMEPLLSRFAVGRGSIGTGQGLQPMAHRSNQPSNSFGIRRNTGALVYRVAVSRPNAPNTTGFSAPASYTGRPPILNVQRAPTQPPVRHYGSQQRHSFGGTPFRPAASRPPLWSPYRGVMPVAKARSATQSSIKMPQDKIGMAEVLNKARELYIKSKSEAPAYALLPDDERTATLTVKWEKEERSVKDAMINKATQEEIAVRMTETFGHSPDTARNVVAILKDSARFEAAVAALNPKENGNADTSLDEEHISEALDDTVLNEDTLSDAAAPDAMEQQAQPSSIDAQSPTQSQADHGDTMRIVREFNKYYAEKRIRYRERFPYLNEVDRRLRAFNEWTIREATGKSPSKRLKVICSDDASIEQERKKRANFAKQKYAKAIEIWFREEGHEHAESIGLKGKNIREQARKEIYNNLPDSEKEKWKAKARESLKKEEIAIYGGPNYNGPLFRRDPGAPPPREVPTLSDVLKGELGSPLGAGGGDVSGAVNRSYIVGPASAIIAEFATDINHRALILGPNAPAMKPQRTALLNTVVVRLRAQCNLDLDADKVDRHIKYLLKKAREYDGVIRKGGDPSKIFGKLEEPSKNAILIMHAWQKHKGESMPMDDVYKSSLIGDMSHQQQQLAQRQQQLHQERMLENGLLEIGIGAAAGGGAGGIGDFQRQHSSSAHMATQPNLQNLMALFPGAAPRMPFDIPGVSQAQPIPQQPPGGLINMGYQGPGHMEHLIGRTSSSGAGAVTGFDVFCKEHRPSKPDHMDPRDFKKRLQGVWDQMSHNDKQGFEQKALSHRSGLPHGQVL